MGTKKSRGAKSLCVSIHVDQHIPKFSYFLEHGNIFGQEHQYFAPLAHKSAYIRMCIYTYTYIYSVYCLSLNLARAITSPAVIALEIEKLVRLRLVDIYRMTR